LPHARRAAAQWKKATPCTTQPCRSGNQHLDPKSAKPVAIEVLLAGPESLHDDVLESALYLLRERLQV
jgi:hypothetical protein